MSITQNVVKNSHCFVLRYSLTIHSTRISEHLLFTVCARQALEVHQWTKGDKHPRPFEGNILAGVPGKAGNKP